MGLSRAYAACPNTSADRAPGDMPTPTWSTGSRTCFREFSAAPATALRAGLPPRPCRRGAGGDLPPEARGRRQQGRHRRISCAEARQEERQAHRLHRRGAGIADRRARPAAAGLRSGHVYDSEQKGGGMIRSQIPRFRLPESVIDEEVATSLGYGPVMHFGTRVDSLKALLARAMTPSSSAPARRAAATSTCPAARKPAPTSISASTGSPTSRSATSTRSASA
jgi:hypothetical protein